MRNRFDATAEFQLDSNPGNRWSYGYSIAGSVGYSFIPFDRSEVTKSGAQSWTMASYNPSGTPATWRNVGPETRYGVAPGQLSIHPGPRPDGDYVILRFTVPADDVYKVSGRFFSGDQGAMDARVVLNEAFDSPLQVFAVADDSAVLMLKPLALRAGERLDIVVGNRGNFGSGNTPVQVVIEPSVVGFALGGGGSKGDFQVGALHYLKAQGWQPDVVCGTSVGSVNGLKIAEGEGTPEQGLAGLTQLWLSLKDYRGFFQEEDWLMADGSEAAAFLRRYLVDFASLNADSDERLYATGPLTLNLMVAERRAIEARREALLKAVTDPAMSGLLASLGSIAVLGPLSVIGLAVSGMMIADLVKDIANLLGSATSKTSIFNLGPTRAMAGQSLDLARIGSWADAGGRLRIATVGLISGDVHIIDERGRLFDRDGAPFMDGAELDPACQPSFRRVKALRIAMARQRVAARVNDAAASDVAELSVELEAAEEALRACIASHPSSPRPLTVGLVDAMVASSTMPFFFPPVHLGRDAYVDGGLREVIPLQSALDCGANTVFAIPASRTAITVASSDVATNLGAIALRSTLSIAIDEVAYSDVRPLVRYSNEDIHVIEPRVDIHTTFTVYPAFIRNRIAYGFMCAADAVNPPAVPDAARRCREIADRIALLRYGCARLECWRSGQPVPPAQIVVPLPAGGGAEVRAVIAAHKAEIATLVAERVALGGAMPPVDAPWGNAPAWSVGDEAHPWGEPGFKDDAEITLAGVPDALPAGATASVKIVATNTGTTAWTAAKGYRLVFRPGFGLPHLAVPGDVGAGASARFVISLPAPAGASADFECQMMQGQAKRFGARSERVRIVVASPAEPARCGGIRESIGAAKKELVELQGSLTGDTRTDARIRGQMIQVNRRIKGLKLEGQGLGCAL